MSNSVSNEDLDNGTQSALIQQEANITTGVVSVRGNVEEYLSQLEPKSMQQISTFGVQVHSSQVESGSPSEVTNQLAVEAMKSMTNELIKGLPKSKQNKRINESTERNSRNEYVKSIINRNLRKSNLRTRKPEIQTPLCIELKGTSVSPLPKSVFRQSLQSPLQKHLKHLTSRIQKVNMMKGDRSQDKMKQTLINNGQDEFDQAIVTVQHSDNQSICVDDQLSKNDKNTNTSQDVDTHTENSIEPPQPIFSKEPRISDLTPPQQKSMTPPQQKSMTPPGIGNEHLRENVMNIMFVDESAEQQEICLSPHQLIRVSIEGQSRKRSTEVVSKHQIQSLNLLKDMNAPAHANDYDLQLNLPTKQIIQQSSLIEKSAKDKSSSGHSQLQIQGSAHGVREQSEKNMNQELQIIQKPILQFQHIQQMQQQQPPSENQEPSIKELDEQVIIEEQEIQETKRDGQLFNVSPKIELSTKFDPQKMYYDNLYSAQKKFYTKMKNSPSRANTSSRFDDYLIHDTIQIAKRVMAFRDQYDLRPMKKIHSLNPRSSNARSFKTQLGGKMVGYSIENSTDSNSKLPAIVMPVRQGSVPHNLSACGQRLQLLHPQEFDEMLQSKQKSTEKEQQFKQFGITNPQIIRELDRRGSSQMIFEELQIQKKLNQYFRIQDKEKKLNKLENIHKRIKSLNEASLSNVQKQVMIEINKDDFSNIVTQSVDNQMTQTSEKLVIDTDHIESGLDVPNKLNYVNYNTFLQFPKQHFAETRRQLQELSATHHDSQLSVTYVKNFGMNQHSDSERKSFTEKGIEPTPSFNNRFSQNSNSESKLIQMFLLEQQQRNEQYQNNKQSEVNGKSPESQKEMVPLHQPKLYENQRRDVKKSASSNFDVNDQMLERMSNRLNKSALSKFSQLYLTDGTHQAASADRISPLTAEKVQNQVAQTNFEAENQKNTVQLGNEPQQQSQIEPQLEKKSDKKKSPMSKSKQMDYIQEYFTPTIQNIDASRLQHQRSFGHSGKKSSSNRSGGQQQYEQKSIGNNNSNRKTTYQSLSTLKDIRFQNKLNIIHTSQIGFLESQNMKQSLKLLGLRKQVQERNMSRTGAITAMQSSPSYRLYLQQDSDHDLRLKEYKDIIQTHKRKYKLNRLLSNRIDGSTNYQQAIINAKSGDKQESGQDIRVQDELPSAAVSKQEQRQNSIFNDNLASSKLLPTADKVKQQSQIDSKLSQEHGSKESLEQRIFRELEKENSLIQLMSAKQESFHDGEQISCHMSPKNFDVNDQLHQAASTKEILNQSNSRFKNTSNSNLDQIMSQVETETADDFKVQKLNPKIMVDVRMHKDQDFDKIRIQDSSLALKEKNKPRLAMKPTKTDSIPRIANPETQNLQRINMHETFLFKDSNINDSIAQHQGPIGSWPQNVAHKGGHQNIQAKQILKQYQMNEANISNYASQLDSYQLIQPTGKFIKKLNFVVLGQNAPLQQPLCPKRNPKSKSVPARDLAVHEHRQQWSSSEQEPNSHTFRSSLNQRDTMMTMKMPNIIIEEQNQSNSKENLKTGDSNITSNENLNQIQPMIHDTSPQVTNQAENQKITDPSKNVQNLKKIYKQKQEMVNNSEMTNRIQKGKNSSSRNVKGLTNRLKSNLTSVINEDLIEYMDQSRQFKFDDPLIEFVHHGSFSTERNDPAQKQAKPGTSVIKHFQSYAITPKHLATPVGHSSAIQNYDFDSMNRIAANGHQDHQPKSYDVISENQRAQENQKNSQLFSTQKKQQEQDGLNSQQQKNSSIHSRQYLHIKNLEKSLEAIVPQQQSRVFQGDKHRRRTAQRQSKLAAKPQSSPFTPTRQPVELKLEHTQLSPEAQQSIHLKLQNSRISKLVELTRRNHQNGLSQNHHSNSNDKQNKRNTSSNSSIIENDPQMLPNIVQLEKQKNLKTRNGINKLNLYPQNIHKFFWQQQQYKEKQHFKSFHANNDLNTDSRLNTNGSNLQFIPLQPVLQSLKSSQSSSIQPSLGVSGSIGTSQRRLGAHNNPMNMSFTIDKFENKFNNSGPFSPNHRLMAQKSAFIIQNQQRMKQLAMHTKNLQIYQSDKSLMRIQDRAPQQPPAGPSQMLIQGTQKTPNIRKVQRFADHQQPAPKHNSKVTDLISQESEFMSKDKFEFGGKSSCKSTSQYAGFYYPLGQTFNINTTAMYQIKKLQSNMSSDYVTNPVDVDIIQQNTPIRAAGQSISPKK